MKLLALLSTGLGLAAAAPLLESRSQKCNGSPELCDWKYSNVTFIGTHDSPFVGPTSNLATNQGVDVTLQLKKGIRFLQGQTHLNSDGDLHFCHTSCSLEDGGPVTTYLSQVKTWMDQNPDEVVTMLLTNGDYLNVTVFGDAFKQVGLDSYAYQPEPKQSMGDWPTLGEMIANKTRLVVILDYKGDLSEVPYIIPEFDGWFFETPYDTTDPTFPECSLNRPPGAKPDGLMMIVNHFLDTSILGVLVPDNARDAQTNAASGSGSIGAQGDICQKKYGRKPNFVLVDRFQNGQVFAAQKAFNFASPPYSS